ncbi:MAG: aspartate aminotransferase family protein, partial [Terracoccus sp.]
MLDLQAVSAPSLNERDRGLVWHPYAPLDGPRPYSVTSASGVRLGLTAADGSTYEAIDAMASWWCAVHGYRHPALDAAAHAQIDRFSHVMFGGLTHEPAVALAERLTAIAPGPMSHVFFADSGSVSVEVALKLALQYQAAQGRPRRQRFLTVRGGYHGDTFAAMSVCDPVDGMHSAFPGILARHVFALRPPPARFTPLPSQLNAAFVPESRVTTLSSTTNAAFDRREGCEGWEVDETALAEWTAAFRRLAAEHSDELAAVVVEPVLQGAGGMYVYHPACLRTMREVADEHGLLLVVDEIATGFGRTGRLFATEWAGVSPDVICVGKALTGGYLTLAAVLTTQAVGEAITRSQFRTLLHGPTFMANPLACAVAAASLDLLDQHWANDVQRVGAALATGLAGARELPVVREVRTLGAVGVVQLTEPVDVVALTRAALDRGVWVRPFRDLVYTMPPYLCTDAEIATITA